MTFQLTPLLDLLLIVIFAQFMELRESNAREQADSQQSVTEAERQLDALKHDREEITKQYQDLQKRLANVTAQQVDLKDELKLTKQQRDLVGDLVVALFELPEDTIQKIVQSAESTRDLSPKELERIRAEFRELAKSNRSAAIKHILTFQEIRKRCDVWEVHIAKNGKVSFITDDGTFDFRADGPDEFEMHIFNRYKSLPQPKSLVIVLLTYEDVAFGHRQAALRGLPRATARMREDSAGRTRFEYSNLGFDPHGPKTLRKNTDR